MIRVSDRVYAETKYEGANVSCMVTDRGLVLVDSPMLPEDARDWQDQIRRISTKEIAYLIDTDHHFDHVFTNSLFTRRTIAHRNAFGGIKASIDGQQPEFHAFFPAIWAQCGEKLQQVEGLLPQITFDDRLTLHMGDCTLELTHTGGHTPATIMIYVPEEKVLLTGDNVVEGRHSYPAYGEFRPWIDMLCQIEQMDVKAIVPGHGNVCGLDQVRRMRVYYEALRDQVKRARDAGVSREEAVGNVDLVPLSPADPAKLGKADMVRQITTDVTTMYDQLEKGLI